MAEERSGFFDGWDFPGIEEHLADVPHRVVTNALNAIRDNLDFFFKAFLAKGEWHYSSGWTGRHGTQMEWVSCDIREPPWNADEMPIRIILRPEDMVAAFKDQNQSYSHDELRASLNAWRRAIDEAEAALDVPRVSGCTE